MKHFLLIVILFASAFSTHAQHSTDSIEIKRAGLFFQNGKRLSVKQLVKITETSTEANREMKAARANSDVASLFGFAGGFLIGYPLGAALTGREANWTMAAIGAGLAVVSIPFNSAYKKRALQAVDIYNESLRQTGSRTTMKLGLASNGLRVKIIF
jgi:hypothetical protein